MLSAVMILFNEADFCDYAIRGCLNHVDELIIIEGTWVPEVFGGQRSTDGTVDIIKKYENNPLVSVFFVENMNDAQMKDFYLSKSKTKAGDWLLILDGDELYSDSDWSIIKDISSNTVTQEVNSYRFKSMLFTNDFWTYYQAGFPRLTQREKGMYMIRSNTWADQHGNPLDAKLEHPTINMFHYSYVKSLERLQAKIDYQTNRTGSFPWYIKDGLICRDSVEFYSFRGLHPKVMWNHPKHNYNISKHSYQLLQKNTSACTRGNPENMKRTEESVDFFVSNVYTGGDVLDLGCGDGYGVSLLQDKIGVRGTVYGVDINENKINDGRLAGVNNLFVGDFHSFILPADVKVSSIYSSHSLEHSLNLSKVIRHNIENNLDVEGKFFVVVPLQFGSRTSIGSHTSVVRKPGDIFSPFLSISCIDLKLEMEKDRGQKELWAVFTKHAHPV